MKKNTPYWFDLFWLCVLISGVFFCCLGIPALNPPDEPRYAEIPREMLALHQFLIPHLNGVMYFEKPPLAYWLVAGFMKVFGYSEWAVRASVAVMGVITCLATYALSRRLWNRQTAILSTLILSSSCLFFLMSHLNTTDMSVTFCLTLSLYSFLLAFQHASYPKKWLLLGYIFSGLAMMAKGLIGIAFPALILLIWVGITQQWRLILKARIITGILIILAINLPWLLLVQKQVPDFLHFYFIVQQFERYATPSAGREMHLWLYATIVVLATFPWMFFLPQALKNGPQKGQTAYENMLFLITWPSFIILFFALSHSILIPYLLPITPPLAIIIGKHINDLIAKNPHKNSFKIPASLTGFFYLILGAGFFICFHLAKIAPTTFLIISAVLFLFLGVLILASTHLSSLKSTVFCIALSGYLSLTLGWLIYCHLDKQSIKTLATTIHSLLQKHPRAEVVNYGFYRQDLPYYTHHLVTIMADYPKEDFGELTFGYTHSLNSHQWMISNATFKKRWNSHQRLYVVISLDLKNQVVKHFGGKAYLIQQTPYDALITNRKPT